MIEFNIQHINNGTYKESKILIDPYRIESIRDISIINLMSISNCQSEIVMYSGHRFEVVEYIEEILEKLKPYDRDRKLETILESKDELF